MSRERKLAESIARKKQHRDSSEARALRTKTLSSGERIENSIADLKKQRRKATLFGKLGQGGGR